MLAAVCFPIFPWEDISACDESCSGCQGSDVSARVKCSDQVWEGLAPENRPGQDAEIVRQVHT